MAKTKKITQNINKDAGLMDLPKVNPGNSQWETKWANYLTCNIGDIVPIYVDEVLADEKRGITSAMLSHMTTPIAPIFNAQYTEIRSWFVPYRLCADLLGGYKTRKSPFVKVFGEDPASANAQIIVPLADQKLPDLTSSFKSSFNSATKNPYGGLADSLDMESAHSNLTNVLNFLSMAGYELIYQKGYRNQNRESATSSNLYRFLFDGYNRTSSIAYDDSFHIAQREKDYFTGAQPFTQKGDPVSVSVLGEAPIRVKATSVTGGGVSAGALGSGIATNGNASDSLTSVGDTADIHDVFSDGGSGTATASFFADLKQAKGVDIESLRLMIKTQEMLEKDMMWGNDFASFLNAHFGCAPMSLELEEPLELKKITIASQMQAIFQTSTTTGEPTILGTVGANVTTRSDPFEILPVTKFLEPGLLIICAVHKAQNSYDSLMYKPKHIFKNKRFDFYVPELNDLGFQPIQGREFKSAYNGLDDAVGYNEAWAEYRYKFNRVHGMFEPSRANAMDYWTLAISNYNDIQSLYKQDVTELDRALSIKSTTLPQFYDAYGFIEYNDKPMSLHSIPGMDGVI